MTPGLGTAQAPSLSVAKARPAAARSNLVPVVGGFVGFWRTKDEIVDCRPGLLGRGLIISPETRRFVPNISDLILRVRRSRIIGEFVDHGLVGLNRSIICRLFLPGQTDIELSPRGISAEGRGPHDRSEDFNRTIQ